MADNWIRSNCGLAVPLTDWFTHREEHLNEYMPRSRPVAS